MSPSTPTPAPVRALPTPEGVGILWMIGATLAFTVLILMIRHVSAEVTAFQAAAFRTTFGALFVLGWMARGGVARIAEQLATDRLWLHGMRAVVGAAAMFSWFWALGRMPVAEAVSLGFTTPLFATILAVLVLGEVVRARRWAATLVGFCGVLIILRPGFEMVSFPALVVLFSAFSMAIAVVLIKILSRTEHPDAMVTYMAVMIAPIAIVAAIPGWVWPHPMLWVELIALGLVGTIGHVCFTRALEAADASLVLAFDYVKMPLVALFGWLVFGEVVDGWTWIGAAVIAASSLYIAHREALRRTARPAPETTA